MRTAFSRRDFLAHLGGGVALSAVPGLAGAATTFLATGPRSSDLTSLDSSFAAFLRERRVAGAALAVAVGQRLVFARGYGVTDRSTAQAVEPRTRFRIASVSKPLTAVATLQLVDAGRLSLDAPVRRLLGLTTPEDRRFDDVSVRHLLHHRGGWDWRESGDLLTSSALNAGMPVERILDEALARPLDFEPGTRFAYSNFGYWLLGRVIEAASGQSYTTRVRSALLEPLGIQDGICGTSCDGVAVARSHADGGGLPLAEAACPRLDVLDSAGGWLISAPDLVRFAAAFPSARWCHVLRPESVDLLFAPPPQRAGGREGAGWYGCGWNVRPRKGGRNVDAWHDGAFEGASAILVRRADRLSWAALFNERRGPRGEELCLAAQPVISAGLALVSDWRLPPILFK